MVLTTEEAAEHVGVTPATIRSWVNRGHLRALVPEARDQRFLLTDVTACHAQRQPKAWHERLDALASALPA